MSLLPAALLLAPLLLSGQPAWATEARATGVWVESLRPDQIAGRAAGDGSVEVYLYGPNNGSPRDVGNEKQGGPGPLRFHGRNLVVKKGRWSAAISPPLSREQSRYYQINFNQPAKAGLTENEHAQDGLNLFRVDDGPACGAEVSASLRPGSLAFAGETKSLGIFQGFACHTASVTVVVTGETGEVLRTKGEVVNGEWEAGQDSPLPDGAYTLQVLDEQGHPLAKESFAARVNHVTLDRQTLRQPVAAGRPAAITGTATVHVIGAVVSAAYAGAVDFDSLRKVVEASVGNPPAEGERPVVVLPDMTVGAKGPKFRLRFLASGPGTWRLFLFEGTSLHELLEETTLTLTP